MSCSAHVPRSPALNRALRPSTYIAEFLFRMQLVAGDYLTVMMYQYDVSASVFNNNFITKFHVCDNRTVRERTARTTHK